MTMSEHRQLTSIAPKNGRARNPAQAMVEFGLALPILLMVMYGLIESGRVLFMYASVVSAARQAVRYGSVTGDNGSGTPYYNDCAGIRNAAKRLGFLQPISDSDIQISYDTGPGTAALSGCPLATSGHPANGDRINVQVSTDFSPIVPLVPFEPFTITSGGSRTLLIGVSVAVNQPGVILTPGGSGAISLLKEATPPSYDTLNQVITYTYTVTNLGSDVITGIALAETRNTNPNPPSCPGTTLAGSASFQCTATYTITQPDIDNGSVTNTAAVTGMSSVGPVIAQTSRTITFIPKPKLALTKDGTAPAVIAPDELVTYVFTLQNTGNVPLTKPYAIIDAKLGAGWDCSAATSPLGVGAATTCTGTYPLKQSDISAGNVTNTATATAMFGTYTVTSNTSTIILNIPPILLDLTASPTNVSSLGQTITYTYTLTNRTNRTMFTLNVTDTRGANKYACSSWLLLLPGFSASCSRTYNSYTQADIDAGLILNQASAKAGSAVSNLASVTVVVNQTIKLTLTKTGSTTSATVLGTAITYTYSLKNDGNVNLSAPFTVADDKFSVNCTGATGTMAPTTTKSCANVVYTVAQADLDAGSIVNHATASAMFRTQTVTSAQVTWQVITFAGARLGIKKSANPSYFTGPGQTLTYKYTLVNTGGVTLNPPYSVTDAKIPGGVDCSAVNSPGTPLAVGGTVSCTAPYIVSDPDNLLGSVTNTATATANGGAIASLLPSPAVLTVNKFTCTSSKLKHTDPTPIPAGSDVFWTIVNNTGKALQIASITISWSVAPPSLTEVRLAGPIIWPGPTSSSYGGLSLPGGPWPLPMGNTQMELKFSTSASGIRVFITFTETSCPAVDSNVVYPS